MTPDERYAAKMKFRNAPQPFPGAIGAMDCTYIQILAPHEHEEAYVNHWGDHTLNVQAVSLYPSNLKTVALQRHPCYDSFGFQICDPDFKLLNVNARYPGARNDYFIWQNSAAFEAMRRAYDNRHERETWLIGDKIFLFVL